MRLKNTFIILTLLSFSIFFLLCAPTLPNTPGGVTATTDGTESITVTWTAVEGATSYNVYRSDSDAGTYTKIAAVTVTSYEDKDSTLAEDTNYYYKVTAVDSNGESKQSAAAIGKKAAGTVSADICDISNEYTSAKLKINNSASENLVLFKNTISANSLMGCVPASSQEYQMNPLLGSKTSDLFVIRVIKESTYVENESSLTSDIASVFSALAYVDDRGTTVSVGNGMFTGTAPIKFINGTDYHVEIRKDRWGGNIVTFLTPNETKQDYIAAGSYGMYPIIKVQIKQGANIVGLIDKQAKDAITLIQVKEESTEIMEIAANIGSIHANAYMKVTNNYSNFGAYFKNGQTLLMSTLGYEIINSGSTETYNIEGNDESGKEYEALQLSDGPATAGFGDVAIPKIALRNGFTYNVVLNADSTVTITNNEPQMNVTFNGAKIENGIGKVSLGTVTQGDTADTRDFNINNTGTSTIELKEKSTTTINKPDGSGTMQIVTGAIQFADPDSTKYFEIISYPTATSISGSSSSAFSLRLKSTTIGTYEATINVVQADDSSAPFVFRVTGEVAEAAKSNMQVLAPDSSVATSGYTYTFAETASGSTSEPVEFKVQNVGNDNLTIAEVTITGTNADEFAFHESVITAATVIAPTTATTDTTQTFKVKFSPTSAAADKTATITIKSDDGGSADTMFTITLKGTGTGTGS